MSQLVIISNDKLQAKINLLGAEVREVNNISTHHNYMWSGDESVWSGVSPVLFPVVGKTTNGEIRYQGKSYPQGNHGFARTNLFKIHEQNQSSVTLRLDTETVAKQYPFRINFDVTYRLDDNKLITEYSVTNDTHKTAYFSVGAHPAFACPFDDNHKFDDYYIEFSQLEPNLIFNEITPQAFFTGNTRNIANNIIELNNKTFIDDAIIYNNYQSKFITLKERNSNRYIKVSLDGFDWLGIWSKVNAPYVCIEPWCGHSDYLDFTGEIQEKSDIETVLANSSWSRSYSIEFGY